LPPETHFQTDGTKIRNPQLRQLLADQQLGAMALGARTINWLEREIQKRRPALVIEFGSGISTVCLARFLRDVHGKGPSLRMLSIDQDEQYAAQTRALLEKAGLSDSVRVLACPLTMQTIEGHTANCYTMPDADTLADIVGQAEMVLIDGPAAENGARFGTLPLARTYLAPGAEFVLDDALRDGELDTLRRWSELSYVRPRGMRLVDKGLLVGKLVS
jgi:predicted O-methyltransferase YrrM